MLGRCSRCASNQLARERLTRLEEVLLNTRRELLSTKRELSMTRRQLEKQQQSQLERQPHVEQQEQHRPPQISSMAAWPSAIAIEASQPPGSGDTSASSARPDEECEPDPGKLISASLPISSSRNDSNRITELESAGPPGGAVRRSARTPRRLRFDSTGAPVKANRDATPRAALAPSISTAATPNSSSVKAKAAAPVPSFRRGAGLGSASTLDRRPVAPVEAVVARGRGAGRGGIGRGSCSGAAAASCGRPASGEQPPVAAVPPTAQPARRLPLQPVGLHTMQKGRWAASAMSELKKAKLRKARAEIAATTLQAAFRGNAARGIATRRWLEAQCGPLTASLDLSL